MAIEYKYLAHEDEVQQVYKLSSLKENSYMLGGAILPPILRENAMKKECIIAKDGDDVIGFIQFHKRKDGVTTIYHRAVHPDYRGQGIAYKLSRFLHPPYIAKCRPENIPIQHLYEKLGMKRIRIEKNRLKSGKISEVYVYRSID